MEALKTATLLLAEHPAWFVCSVLALTVVVMARYIVKMHAGQREDDKNTISMLEGFRASVDALTKAVDRLVEKSRGG
jgi:hypothetical protein